MTLHAEVTNQRFGNLIAKWPAGRSKPEGVQWLCLCDCGRFRHVPAGHLRGGMVRSCGCLKRRRDNDREGRILNSIKSSAKKRNLPFNLTIEDIVIPEKCPLLGIPIKREIGKLHANSPSVDRIIPALGYTKGNIQVISHKANTIKSNASLEELETVARNWRQQRR